MSVLLDLVIILLSGFSSGLIVGWKMRPQVRLVVQIDGDQLKELVESRLNELLEAK